MKKAILKYALQNAIRYNGKASVGAIVGKILGEFPRARKDVKKVSKEIAKVVNQVNSMWLKDQISELKKLAPKMLEKKKKKERVLPNLPKAKKVVMRLAPYPSGPLHIGNARQAVLNDEYVKRYKGKLILFIDDTIGSKDKDISKDAYKLIPEGLKWLGVKFGKKIYYKSDRLNIYYKYAEKLIKEGYVYVCSCEAKILRDNRAKGVTCDCRSLDIKNNLKEWKRMFRAKEGSKVLRIKTDIQHKNPAFRDRVLFRISNRKHAKVGKKYRVWPLLEFSWAIDDHLLGISHIIRGKELMMESEMQRLIWKIFKWKSPVIIHTGLLELEGVKLSKSKSKKEVLSGKFKGWDDPRTWSLQSLERRGLYPEAVRKFLLGFGLNQNEINIPIDNLYVENKKIVESKARRYFFVWNPYKIKIKNAPKMKAKIPYHPNYNEMGYRKIKSNDMFYVSDDIIPKEYYRFIDLFNFKNKEFLSRNYDPKMKAKMIHWLPVVRGLVNVEIVMIDGSIKKGLGESDMKDIKVGDVVQLYRFGFCRLDKRSKDKLVFYYSHN